MARSRVSRSAAVFLGSRLRIDSDVNALVGITAAECGRLGRRRSEVNFPSMGFVREVSFAFMRAFIFPRFHADSPDCVQLRAAGFVSGIVIVIVTGGDSRSRECPRLRQCCYLIVDIFGERFNVARLQWN